MGYSPWRCKELDTTEQLTLSLFQSAESSVLGGQWETPGRSSLKAVILAEI